MKYEDVTLIKRTRSSLYSIAWLVGGRHSAWLLSMPLFFICPIICCFLFVHDPSNNTL